MSSSGSAQGGSVSAPQEDVRRRWATPEAHRGSRRANADLARDGPSPQSSSGASAPTQQFDRPPPPAPLRTSRARLPVAPGSPARVGLVASERLGRSPTGQGSSRRSSSPAQPDSSDPTCEGRCSHAPTTSVGVDCFTDYYARKPDKQGESSPDAATRDRLASLVGGVDLRTDALEPILDGADGRNVNEAAPHAGLSPQLGRLRPLPVDQPVRGEAADRRVDRGRDRASRAIGVDRRRFVRRQTPAGDEDSACPPVLPRTGVTKLAAEHLLRAHSETCRPARPHDPALSRSTAPSAAARHGVPDLSRERSFAASGSPSSSATADRAGS